MGYDGEYTVVTHLVPNTYGPDKRSPTKSVPMDKWSLEYSVCPGGQAMEIPKYGHQIGWGPFVQGDKISGDHMSMETEFDGDRLSRGTESGGPEVRGSNGF